MLRKRKWLPIARLAGRRKMESIVCEIINSAVCITQFPYGVLNDEILNIKCFRKKRFTFFCSYGTKNMDVEISLCVRVASTFHHSHFEVKQIVNCWKKTFIISYSELMPNKQVNRLKFDNWNIMFLTMIQCIKWNWCLFLKWQICIPILLLQSYISLQCMNIKLWLFFFQMSYLF